MNRLVFLTGLLIVGLMFPLGVASAESWTKERVTTLYGDSWLVDAEVDDNHVVHMTWLDNNPGQYQIYYNYRTSAGGYGSPLKLSDAGTNLGRPRIAVYGDGTAIVVWSEYKSVYGQSIYFRWRNPDGSWALPSPTPYYSEGTPVSPDVAIRSPNNFAVAWHDQDSAAVYVGGEWMDGGVMVGTVVAMWPRIVYDSDDNLHLVYQAFDWYELGDIYGWKIVYRCRSSATGQWGPRITIDGGGPAPDGMNAMFPDIAIGPDNYPYIIYRREGPPIGIQPGSVNQLYCTCVRGLTLEAFQVDDYGQYSPDLPMYPSIKVARVSGNVYMTWSKEYQYGTNLYSVYYREMVDGILYDTQRPLEETNIEKSVIVLDEFYSFPIGWFQTGYIIYEDYSAGGDQGEIYLLHRDLPVIPEFPSNIVLSLLMFCTLLTAILAKAKKRHNIA